MFPDEEGTETRRRRAHPHDDHGSTMFPDEEGTEPRSAAAEAAWARRSTMFPDEEGTETRRQAEFLDPATPVRRCSPMRRGLKHDQNGKHHKRPRAFDDVPR